MKNLLIGMHGGFSYEKFNRDFKEGFCGIEACMFPDENSIETLATESRRRGFNIGIHFPLHAGTYKYRDPLFLSRDHDEAENAYAAFEKELSYASRLNADYVLAHFPKPAILDDKLDFKCWRFVNDNEWVKESEYPNETFIEKSMDMFERLSLLSNKYNIRIVLENDVLNKYIYESTFFLDMLDRYPNLKICLDTGRLHLLEEVDPHFSSIQFIQRMAKYTYIVHLWNVRVDTNLAGGHYPALPHLKEIDGWADIDKYLSIIAGINKDVKILFEHRSELISDLELLECYSWVQGYFK